MKKNTKPEIPVAETKISKEELFAIIRDRLNQPQGGVRAIDLARSSGFSSSYIISIANYFRKNGMNIPKLWNYKQAFIKKSKTERPELFEQK